MLEELAALLDVSLFELMSGEKRPEEPEGTAQVDAGLADTVLAETVQQAKRSGRHLKGRFRLILGVLFLCFFGLLLVLAANRRAVSRTLDEWMEKAGLPWHGCELSVAYVPHVPEGPEGFYLYRTTADSPHRFLYHVCGVDGNGETEELFGLEEYGMDLDRSPVLRADARYLYVLFDGLDDENGGERVYLGTVEADPQGFSPALYRYDRSTGAVERMDAAGAEPFLLTDAFTWQGKSLWLESRFQNAIGGLDLGFYREDGTNLHTVGTFAASLSGNGGLKTGGCLWQDAFYICGPAGVYRFSLADGEETLVYPSDLRDCLRAGRRRDEWEQLEYQWVYLPESSCYALAGTGISYREP